MHVIVFYVPESHLDEVREALFEAGAGRYGRYDRASWEVPGTGRFRPLEGSSPFLGREGVDEIVPEFRVEMICEDDLVEGVLRELVRVHPYEEPAYYSWRVHVDGGEGPRS